MPQMNGQDDHNITKVRILGRDSIHVGYGLIPHIIRTCLSEIPSSTYVLITDSNIAPLYLDQFSQAIEVALSEGTAKYPRLPAGSRFLSKIIAPGETSKSRDTKADLEDWMLSHRCTRDTVVLALGGGVIGDMIGFLAATFMRGVTFVQIPTTLLAMVDSAIGGKTAVDTPLGKNLIGSFHQPAYIFEDMSFLNTLPNREFINGMAEIIKTAAIWNAEKFSLLEDSAAQILDILTRPVSHHRFDDIRELLKEVVISSILVKAEVVSADEKEGGLRNLLNFGHSIGHAYEAILTPEILHGEAVSVGMIKEAELSRYLGHLSAAAVGRLRKCLIAWGLPTDVHDSFITTKTKGRKTPVDRLLDIMAVDKKNSGKIKRIVLLKEIGKCLEMKASDTRDEDIALILSDNILVHNDVSGPRKHKITCRPPGSKSISNRALLLAALSGQEVRLCNLLTSDDTRYMQNALELLGAAQFQRESEDILLVKGTGRLCRPQNGEQVYLGNAGTAARFLTSVVAMIGDDKPTIVTGNSRMKVRPIGPLVDTLRANDVKVEYLEREGCLPLSIRSQFRGGRIELSASISSQYVSSILMVAPLAKEPVHLFLTGGQVISELYIDMTIQMMSSFGVTVQKVSSNEYVIPLAKYTAPSQYEIESDASSATYPLALAAALGLEVHIPNIGSASLQGDARFATEILRPMGCSVQQTESTTTVIGPAIGALKALQTVDMETMTDAFLTATVLAAMIKGKMSITGIANQRVKECNRIAAMSTELKKFGVRTEELPDGITIYGTGVETLNTPAKEFASDGIDTHDDHRVAMSFSVLGCVAPEATLILDKSCTSKTWPEWWDVLGKEFSISLSGCDELPKRARQEVDAGRSIIIIGMRGAGKTTLGRMAADILGRPFLDLDNVLEQDNSITIPELVAKHGWERFRELEVETLQKFVQQKPNDFVAACGGGIVETPAAQDILRDFTASGGIVLQIHRDIDDIVQFLNVDTTRPAWNKSVGSNEQEIRNVWERREPIFERLANFQYFSTSSNTASTSLKHFLRLLTGAAAYHEAILSKQRSFFLSLTFPDLTSVTQLLPQITAGCDAIELRVDLLEDNGALPGKEYVTRQIALLRQYTCKPLIFTIRTKSQGGKWPDNAEEAASELMQLAGKLAVEYIDFEMTWSDTCLERLRAHTTRSRIIASHHDVSGDLSFRAATWAEYYSKGCAIGDIVKLVGRARDMSDNYALETFKEKVTKQGGPPLIAINMGQDGMLSRVLNECLTPVTHELMPLKAAPGQMSIKEINQALGLLGQIPSKKFFIFGNPVAHSRSPALHNSGFTLFGLPHVYERAEESDVDAYRTILTSPSFGGASVTIPHKQNIMQFITEVTEEARQIGAVNTVIPVPGGLRGDNTDWIGIKETLLKNSTLSFSGTNGIVLGAGGTARAAIFALLSLGLKRIYILNRSRPNIDQLVKIFPDIIPITSLDDAKGIEDLSAAISTVPGDGTLDATLEELLGTVLPRHVVGATLVEMAYKPSLTAVMELAEKHKWRTVPGLEPLVEQGIRQFTLWTGLDFPASIARRAVLGEDDPIRAPKMVQKVIGNWSEIA